MVGTASIYGPSRTVIENEFSCFGVSADFVDTSDIQNIEAG
jgi:O-acetylhomoserine/O-acetylserine sulfhydrylase-like pyridoxal-dependent enzyme